MAVYGAGVYGLGAYGVGAAQTWPVMDYAVCWTAGPTVSPVQDLWCSMTERTEGKVTVQRGKQYELDTQQPGVCTVTLRNDDGALDPSNGASPYAGQVLPYRLFRVRAQYPPTANLLTGDQATALYSSDGAVTTSTLPQWVTTGLGATIVPLSGSSNEYQASVLTGSAGATLLAFYGFSVAGGQTYSGQFAFTATVSLGLRAQFDWYDKTGTLISSTTGSTVTGTSGTATVTGTAPASAAGARLQVYVVTAPASTSTVGVSAVQVEKAAAPSGYVTPSTWYPMFTGYVERWPQQWSSGGNYGISTLTIVDVFAWLANRGLNWPAYLEMLKLGPTWFYPLDEGTGAAVFNDLTNNRKPATIQSPVGDAFPYMTLSPGDSLTNTGGYLPLGIPGPVVGLMTPVAPSGSQGSQSVDLTAGGLNPTGPQGSSFTRVIAFRGLTNPDVADVSVFSYVLPNTSTSLGAAFSMQSGTGDVYDFNVTYYYNNGYEAVAQTSPSSLVLDSGWHLLVVSLSGNTLTAWLDGSALTVTLGGPLSLNAQSGWDRIGGGDSNSTSKTSLAAEFAFAAEIPYVLSSAQVGDLYQAFRYAWGSQSPTHTETSDGRYSRLLAWAAFAGVSAVDAGASVDYGPAVDVQGGTSPTALLAALEAVVTSEMGEHFVAAGGAVTFQSRRARVNQAPLVTFGENSGEVPYQSAGFDFDPTRIGNDVTTTAVYSAAAAGTSYRVTDATSIGQYGDVTMQRQVNTLDADELQGGAECLLYQNKQPSLRLQALPVNVAANPAAWPDLLARELGDCVTVNRRPANAPALSLTGFVEQIRWDLSDTGAALCTLQISSNAGHQFLQLDSATYGLLDSADAVVGY